MQKNAFLSLLAFGVFALCFFILNVFTPLLHDDLAYLYKFGPKAEYRPTNIPVKNLKDVAESIYWHYLDVNGRFTPHFLLQLVLLAGKWLFNILNTLIFIAFPWLVLKYFDAHGEKKYFLYLFVFLSLWFLMPFFGQTMLWTTGAINYFWTSFFVLIFLYLLKKEEWKANSLVKNIFLFVFSLFIGWTNESVTIGLAAALFFYVLKNYKSINPTVALMILGFWLGVALIVFSPGTFNRVNNEVSVSAGGISVILKQKVIDAVAIFYLLKYNILVTFILGGIAFFREKMKLKDFFKENFIIMLGLLFSAAFVFLVGKIEERILFGVAFYLLLINFSLLMKIVARISLKLEAVLSSALLVFFAVNFYQAFSYLKIYDAAYINMEQRIRQNHQTIVDFPKFSSSRFLYNTLDRFSDSKDYHNRVRSFYYGVPEVSILPADFYDGLYVKKDILLPKNQLQGWNVKVYKTYKFGYLLIEVPADFNYKKQLSSDVLYKDKIIKRDMRARVLPVGQKKYVVLDADNSLIMFDRIMIKTANLPSDKVFEFYKK